MLPSFARHTVVVKEPVMVLDHGTETADWTQEPVSATPVEGCSIQPVDGSEDPIHRNGVLVTHRGWLPPGTSVSRHARIEHQGVDHDVVDKPLRHEYGLSVDHVEVLLHHWEG